MDKIKEEMIDLSEKISKFIQDGECFTSPFTLEELKDLIVKLAYAIDKINFGEFKEDE